MMTLEKVLDTVRAFIADRGGQASAIQKGTRLLGEGHVDSFALIDLIVALEGAMGRPIPDGALIPEDFETVEILFSRLAAI